MNSPDIPTDPILFEYWCAEKLADQGWEVSLTPQTGDGGVDLVARSLNCTLAIQCKRMSRPAGVASVQQAVAGKVFLGLQKACVISTSGFTRSAISFSDEADVILVRADQIEKLAIYIAGDFATGYASSQTEFSGVSEIEEKYNRYGKTVDLIDVAFTTDGHAEIASACNRVLEQSPGSLSASCKRFLRSLDDGLGKGRLTPTDLAILLNAADVVFCEKVQLTEKNLTILSGSLGDHKIKQLKESNTKSIKYFECLSIEDLESLKTAYTGLLKHPELHFLLSTYSLISDPENPFELPGKFLEEIRDKAMHGQWATPAKATP